MTEPAGYEDLLERELQWELVERRPERHGRRIPTNELFETIMEFPTQRIAVMKVRDRG